MQWQMPPKRRFGGLQGHRQEWALLRRHESEDIFGIQIAGSLPSVMTQCAELISNEVDCDFIDMNMGCPIDLVYRKVRGARNASGCEVVRVLCLAAC